VIDLRAARQDPERFRSALARKGAADAFDNMLAADEYWRSLVPRVDELRAKQRLKGRPTPEQLEELGRVKEELRTLEEELASAESDRDDWLGQVPNPPDPSAPDGDSDEDAEELRRWGEPAPDGPEHTEVGRFELERAARLSGSRFGFMVGDTALVGLALYRFALDRAGANGYLPVIPPVLVREEAMYGTGFFPTDRSNIYALEADQLYLTGTAEVALAGLHMTEILDQLPLRYSRSRRSSRRRSDCPTASSTSPPATSARRRRRSTTSRHGSRRSSATARSPPPRTRPTSRRGGSASATASTRSGSRRRTP
jgi:seryl-tRNA synthetase